MSDQINGFPIDTKNVGPVQLTVEGFDAIDALADGDLAVGRYVHRADTLETFKRVSSDGDLATSGGIELKRVRGGDFDSLEDLSANIVSMGVGSLFATRKELFRYFENSVSPHTIMNNVPLRGVANIVGVSLDAAAIIEAAEALSAEGGGVVLVEEVFDVDFEGLVHVRDLSNVAIVFGRSHIKPLGNPDNSNRGGFFRAYDCDNCFFSLPDKVDMSGASVEGAFLLSGGRNNKVSVGTLIGGSHSTLVVTGPAANNYGTYKPALFTTVVRRCGRIGGQRVWPGGGTAKAVCIAGGNAIGTRFVDIRVQGGRGDAFGWDNAPGTKFIGCTAENADDIAWVEGTTEYTLRVNSDDNFLVEKVMRWRENTEAVEFTDYTRAGPTLTITDDSSLVEGDHLIAFGELSAGFWGEHEVADTLADVSAELINCVTSGCEVDVGNSQAARATVRGHECRYALGVGSRGLWDRNGKMVVEGMKFYMPLATISPDNRVILLAENPGGRYEDITVVGGSGVERFYFNNGGTLSESLNPSYMRRVRWTGANPPIVRVRNSVKRLILDDVSCYFQGEDQSGPEVTIINTAVTLPQQIFLGRVAMAMRQSKINCPTDYAIYGTGNTPRIDIDDCEVVSVGSVAYNLGSSCQTRFGPGNKWPKGGAALGTTLGVVTGEFIFTMDIGPTPVDLPFVSARGFFEATFGGASANRAAAKFALAKSAPGQTRVLSTVVSAPHASTTDEYAIAWPSSVVPNISIPNQSYTDVLVKIAVM